MSAAAFANGQSGLIRKDQVEWRYCQAIFSGWTEERGDWDYQSPLAGNNSVILLCHQDLALASTSLSILSGSLPIHTFRTTPPSATSSKVGVALIWTSEKDACRTSSSSIPWFLRYASAASTFCGKNGYCSNAILPALACEFTVKTSTFWAEMTIGRERKNNCLFIILPVHILQGKFFTNRNLLRLAQMSRIVHYSNYRKHHCGENDCYISREFNFFCPCTHDYSPSILSANNKKPVVMFKHAAITTGKIKNYIPLQALRQQVNCWSQPISWKCTQVVNCCSQAVVHASNASAGVGWTI